MIDKVVNTLLHSVRISAKTFVCRCCSVKNVLSNVLQNPQENTYVGISLLIKLPTRGLQLFLKKTPT